MKRKLVKTFKRISAWMLKKLEQFLIWVISKILNSIRRESIRDQIKPLITKLYKEIAQNNLRLKTEVIKVKKGKRRYDLLIFETPEGVIKFNLGRRWEEDTPIIEEPLTTEK